MYYSVDRYEPRSLAWVNWMETASLSLAKDRWRDLVKGGTTARIREVRDITSGNKIIA